MVKQTTDLHTDQLAQATLAEFVRRGHLTRHLAKMKKVYRSRLDAMETALEKFMPEESYVDAAGRRDVRVAESAGGI